MIESKRRYKRLFDLTVLSTSHVLLAPLLIFLWTGIPFLVWVEDRGPVFYRQKRVGKDGRMFTALKFRTMIRDAEKTTGPIWAQPNDPRVTRVGRLLRRSALDELPQLLSIWNGDLSLIGPRAERPEIHKCFAQEIPGWEKRLAVRPGLTGIAQVYGGYNLPPERKLRYDLEYIRRMSLWLDLKLLFLSIVNTIVLRWDRRDEGR